MKISVRSTLGAFAKDCVVASRLCEREMRGVVSEGIRVGNSVAKDNARRTAGAHGPYYPDAFRTEMSRTYHAGAATIYQGTYGPLSSLPQGDMEFEWGSRNQEPHLDLNKSADLVGPAMPREASSRLDRVFWP